MVRKTMNEAALVAEEEARRLERFETAGLLTKTRFSNWQLNFLHALNESPNHGESDSNIDETEYTSGQGDNKQQKDKKKSRRKRKIKNVEALKLVDLMKRDPDMVHLDAYIDRFDEILTSEDLDDEEREHIVQMRDELFEGRDLKHEDIQQELERHKSRRAGSFVPAAAAACAFLWSMRGIRGQVANSALPPDGEDPEADLSADPRDFVEGFESDDFVAQVAERPEDLFIPSGEE
jgi:hypothetical protein